MLVFNNKITEYLSLFYRFFLNRHLTCKVCDPEDGQSISSNSTNTIISLAKNVYIYNGVINDKYLQYVQIILVNHNA